MDVFARIQWVLDNRPDKAPNERAWSMGAKKTAQYLTTVLTRAREKRAAKEDLPDISVDTVAQLADAAGISKSWLAFGEGSPDVGKRSDLTPAAVEFMKWYFGGNRVVVEMVTQHPDVTMGDLLALHHVQPRHGETDPEAWWATVQQNRRGKPAGVARADADVESEMRAQHKNARKSR